MSLRERRGGDAVSLHAQLLPQAEATASLVPVSSSGDTATTAKRKKGSRSSPAITEQGENSMMGEEADTIASGEAEGGGGGGKRRTLERIKEETSGVGRGSCSGREAVRWASTEDGAGATQPPKRTKMEGGAFSVGAGGGDVAHVEVDSSSSSSSSSSSISSRSSSSSSNTCHMRPCSAPGGTRCGGDSGNVAAAEAQQERPSMGRKGDQSEQGRDDRGEAASPLSSLPALSPSSSSSVSSSSSPSSFSSSPAPPASSPPSTFDPRLLGTATARQDTGGKVTRSTIITPTDEQYRQLIRREAGGHRSASVAAVVAFPLSREALIRRFSLPPPEPMVPPEALAANKLDIEFGVSGKNSSSQTTAVVVLEDTVVCLVCGIGDSHADNAVIYCDRCLVPVHQACYAVGSVPKGDWFCDPCRMFEDGCANWEGGDLLVECDSELGGELGGELGDEERAALASVPRCELCPVRGGALKATLDDRWCHVECALWMPPSEVAFEDPENMNMVSLALAPLRNQLACIVCSRRGGAVLQCEHRGCTTSFHASCAMRSRPHVACFEFKEIKIHGTGGGGSGGSGGSGGGTAGESSGGGAGGEGKDIVMTRFCRAHAPQAWLKRVGTQEALHRDEAGHGAASSLSLGAGSSELSNHGSSSSSSSGGNHSSFLSISATRRQLQLQRCRWLRYHEAWGATVGNKDSPKCPKNHKLEHDVATDGMRCDLCGAEQQCGAHLLGCHKTFLRIADCDYDLCQRCVDASTTTPPPETQELAEWRASLSRGSEADVKDDHGKWYEARVIEVKGDKYKFHYRGWSERFEEWKSKTSECILPRYTIHTKPTPIKPGEDATKYLATNARRVAGQEEKAGGQMNQAGGGMKHSAADIEARWQHGAQISKCGMCAAKGNKLCVCSRRRKRETGGEVGENEDGEGS